MDALTKWSAPVAAKVRRPLTFKQLALLAFACIAAVSAPARLLLADNGRSSRAPTMPCRRNVTPISPHMLASSRRFGHRNSELMPTGAGAPR